MYMDFTSHWGYSSQVLLSSGNGIQHTNETLSYRGPTQVYYQLGLGLVAALESASPQQVGPHYWQTVIWEVSVSVRH